MALTPGSAQLPLVPNKQWLYISDPYTDGLVTGPNAAALQESLFCYAYAQGYTGLIMYEMSQFISGGVLTNSSDWTAFINAAAAKGLEVGAAFGGPSILNAVIAWNTSNTAKFKIVISEIEWWNYSSNLPFQEPGPTGTYSFFDSLQMFKNYKSQLTTAGLELYTYNGWTKDYQDEYNSGFGILSIGLDYFTIKGNFTNSGVDSIVGGKMFEANQVIRIDNWPVQGTHTFYKLDATNPVTLVGGNTQLKVGQGKQYSGVGTDTSGTTLISTFTGVAGAGAFTAISSSVTGGLLSLTSAAPHNITPGTDVQVSGALPFTYLGSISTETLPGTSGNTLVLSSPIIINITQKQASGGTTLITTGNVHGLPIGCTILISGLGAGFDGSWVITGTPTTTSFTFNNGNVSLNVPTTPDAGSYQVTTMSTLTYSPNASVIPFNYQNATVRAEFEVTSVAPYTLNPALGITTVKLKGDKTFMFSPTSTVGSNVWLRSTAGVFKWVGGLSGLKLVPPTNLSLAPSYNAGTNETIFYITGTFTGTAFDAGFLYGMVNFDVCYSAAGSYDNTPTYTWVGAGSELEQCSPYVNVFGLHDYVTGRPSYSYVQSRTLQLGQAGASASNPNIKISWIISAEPTFLQPFFIGNPGSGIPRKNVIDAYKYLAYPITPTPNPTQSANVISVEPNTNVQNEVYIDGVIIFKDTDIRPVTTGNGPNIWVDAGTDINITATAGTEVLSGSYCDDCLPTNNCTYSWSVISSNPVGTGTVTPTASTPISGCPGNTTPGTFNYTSPGIYTVRLTINDNSGTVPFTTGQDDITITVSPVASGPFDIFIAPDNLPTCANSNDGGLLNDGSLTASITAAQGPVKPVTYTWSGPNGYSSTTVDNLATPTSSSVRTGLVAGIYQVTAVDSSSPPRSGTQTFTLDAEYPFNNLLSTLVVNASCYGANDGSVTAILSDPNYCAGPIFTDVIPDYEFNIPADWTLQSTWLGNPISIAGGKLVLENTTVFNPLVTYNQWDAQAGPAGNFLPALDTIVFSYNIQTGAWPQNNTTIAIRDKFGTIIPILGPGTVSPNTTYTGTFTLTGQGTNPASTVQITVVDHTTPISGRIYEILRFRLRYQSGISPGSNNLFYDWSNGVNGYGEDQIIGLTAGIYTVEVTDCHGCTATLSSIVTEPDAIIPFIVHTNTTCGLNNGTVTIDSMTGGVAPFTYSWSNGATTQNLTNVPADFYSVIVTDAIGCTGVSNSVQVLGSSSFIAGISGPINVCCDTPIEYSILLPFGNFTWTWSNGQANVNPATYIFSCANKGDLISLTVTNTDTGCVVTESIFVDINTPTNPVTTIKVISGDPNNLTSCIGDEVVIAPLGGAGTGSWNFGAPPDTSNPLTVNKVWFDTYGTPGQPFTFTWSEVDPTTTCYSEASITINYPIGVVLNIDVTPVICGGAVNSGAIDVEVISSCGAPFDISWTGPISGSDTFNGSTYTIPNLISGTYSVTVIDVESNFATESNIIVFTDVPVIDSAVVTNFCFNANAANNSGSIDITVTGGTQPYTYLWTKAGDPGFIETSQDIANLALGNYTVVVSDANGCTTTDNYTIQYSAPINIDVTLASPSCWGICNGFANIEITGGVLPYTVDVTGKPTYIQSLPGPIPVNGICATTYTIEVVDANGCTAVKEFNAGANIDVTQFTTRTVDPSSEEAQDGAIYIDLISGGGGPPYDYLWTGPNGFTATTQDITGLAPGDYQVTIKTVVFGVPQPTCAVSKKFKLQTSCIEFSLEELKVMLFKFQCCAGVLAKEYVQYQEIGRPDLAECKLIDLKYLTLAINALSCIETLPDPSLSCDDVKSILNQINKICDCDCCGNGNSTYNVNYDPFTGALIVVPPVMPGTNPPPPPPPSLLELREDDGTELREDSGDELREN